MLWRWRSGGGLSPSRSHRTGLKDYRQCIGSSDWIAGITCFGPSRSTGCKFTEPQFTKGFAYFLGVPEREKRIWRTRALLRTLGAAELGKNMSEVEVTAEALTSGNKRIDLLIEWKDSSETCYAAAIEAKLGHHVTSGQLPAYRGHLQNVPQERRLLIVISPRYEDVRGALQRQRSREWRWMAWRDLLIAHERALSGEYDDDTYRQFRRTLWDQVRCMYLRSVRWSMTKTQ